MKCKPGVPYGLPARTEQGISSRGITGRASLEGHLCGCFHVVQQAGHCAQVSKEMMLELLRTPLSKFDDETALEVGIRVHVASYGP